MKKIALLALFISFLGCRQKSIEQRIRENNNQIEIEKNQIDDELEIESENVEIGSDEWRRKAEIYLEIEEGETYYDFDNNL